MFHRYWASRRHPGDCPSRAGPPGGSGGERKLCIITSFGRPGGFRCSENFVFSEVLESRAFSLGAGVKAHVVADVHRALVQDDDASGGLRGIGNLVLS